MLAVEHAARLLASINAIASAAEQASAAAQALNTLAEAPADVARWLGPVRQSLARIQLECADARFAAHELRDALPSPSALQPRLI